MKFNHNLIAKMNRRMILDLIRGNGPINRAEIAKITELSIPTVMKITEELEHNQLLQITGKRKSSGGKRPVLYEFVPQAHYLVGIDIGRNQVKALVMDMGANIALREEINTGETLPPEKLINRVIELAKNVIADSGIPKNLLLGMGIGMPGLLNDEHGNVMFSPDFGWENVPLLELFKNAFDLPLLLDNSNRALAIGEQWFGAGGGSNSLVCINLGYGIGAALIENGDIIHGASGTSGEFGHIIMERGGPLCECGNYGCLEAISSGHAIAQRGREAVRSGKNTLLNRICEMDVDKVDAKMVFTAAAAGDIISEDIINRAFEYLGIAIASLINFYDPERIILAGGLTKSKKIFEKKLEYCIDKNRMKKAGTNTTLTYGVLEENATAIGAATMILKSFIDNGGAYL